MRTILYILLLMCVSCVGSPSSDTNDNEHETAMGISSNVDADNDEYENENEIDDDAIVYICTGPKSKRWHTTSDCWGLGSCSGEIIEITRAEAEEQGKTPCKRCAIR